MVSLQWRFFQKGRGDVFIFHTHQTHFSLYLLHCSVFMKLISHTAHNSPIVQPTLPHTSPHPTMTTRTSHTSSSHAPTASAPSPTAHIHSLKPPYAAHMQLRVTPLPICSPRFPNGHQMQPTYGLKPLHSHMKLKVSKQHQIPLTTIPPLRSPLPFSSYTSHAQPHAT